MVEMECKQNDYLPSPNVCILGVEGLCEILLCKETLAAFSRFVTTWILVAMVGIGRSFCLVHISAFENVSW